MTAKAEVRQIKNIDYLVAMIQRMEERSHDIDGIIEDAATQEILHNAERQTA